MLVMTYYISAFANRISSIFVRGGVKNQSSYSLGRFSSEVWSTNFNPEELTYEAYFTVA